MLPLFFYGVLMSGLASGRMAELVALLEPGLAGTTRGRLYAVPDRRGHYPLLVADPAGEPVHGVVHRPGPAFNAAALAELDRFEGYLPDDPAGSAYLRRPVEVSLDGTMVSCDAYLAHRSRPPGTIPVPHGDFLRYLAETGAAPLPG